ncbi:MAG: DEAD/DEAH box helicase [Vicinamibacteria bacterium]
MTPPGPTLRGWQSRALDAMAEWREGSFLISAAPGAGKTIPSLVFAAQELRAGRIRRVAVVCPTSPLTRQWARAAARVGLHLLPDAPGLRPPGDFQGVALTYARVAVGAAEYARTCSPGTLVIADEAHHLGEDLAWGAGFKMAFSSARRWMLLSGTPFRSDNSAIPGVVYNGGECVPDVSYGYADAVRDGVCRPVTFVPYDGTLQWQSGDDVIESSFSDVALSARERSRRYRTAISTELADGLPRILRAADERLRRGGGHRDAGGLVIAADSEHAAQVAKVLREVSGEAPTVVVHTDPRAHQKLETFRKGTQRWIVAVNMVSEGVDIPRLRVGVYATAAKTPLVFRQIVGRFVRTQGGVAGERSYVFLPADALLRAHAAEVEDELRHVLRRPAEEAPEAFDELPERRRSERTEPEAFVPLSADVAPQLALFGGGPPPPAAPPAPRPAVVVPGTVPPAGAILDAAGPAAGAAAEEPAFQRRRRLRDKRHNLVVTLAGFERRTHREINTWLNREVGVAGVRDSSLEQLERSVQLLEARLERIARRRAQRAS